MGKIQDHLPVKLIMGITYRSDFDLEKLYPLLEKKFSPIEITSQPYDFSSFTPYYQSEMGKGLKKCFLVFSNLIDPAALTDAKIKTNHIEQTYLYDNKRLINLDPGYISQAKLVLATTKNYSHRVYMGQGIFGDVHMHYQNGEYRPNPWTYPDYQAQMNVDFFGAIRKNYLEQLGSPS
jgi:hypothetical protein